MDIAQMIVDILRRGKENDAMNNGGLTGGAGMPMPGQAPQGGMQQGMAPKHGGQEINDIIANMSR